MLKHLLLVAALLFTSVSVSAAPSADAMNSKPQIITLNKRNTLVLRGVVTDQSVAKLQIEMLEMSAKLKPADTIYLVMDTPGGSVSAGLQLIDFAKALPQKVKTITLFAASMGFQIVQNLDERLILPSSTLMSHRASLSGASGEIPGELLVRIKAIMRRLNRMDKIASSRMGISVKKYQRLIADELWLDGQDAISMNAADRLILAKCDSSFQGEVQVELGSFLGIPVTGTMSNCPLITGVMNIQLGKEGTKEDREEASQMCQVYKSDKNSFVKRYISTGLLVFSQK